MKIRLLVTCIAMLACLFSTSICASARECQHVDTVKILTSSIFLGAAPMQYAVAHKMDADECLSLVLSRTTEMSQINLAFRRGDVDFMEEMVLINSYYGSGAAHDATAPVLVLPLERDHAMTLVGQSGKPLKAGATIAVGGCPHDSVLPSVSLGVIVDFLRARAPDTTIVCGTARPQILFKGKGDGVITLLPKGTNTKRVLCVEQRECDFVLLISPKEYSVRLDDRVIIGPEQFIPFTSSALIAQKGRADALEASGVIKRLRAVLTRAAKELADPAKSEQFIAELAAYKGPNLLSGLTEYPAAIPAIAKIAREQVWNYSGCFDTKLLDAADRLGNMFISPQGTQVPNMRDLIHESGCRE